MTQVMKFLNTRIKEKNHKNFQRCWSFIGPEPGGPELTMRD